MNFLAHLYLSGSDHDVMTGNFIGDFVKGRDHKEKYGDGIARGIELHRLIDDFTDHHPVVKQSKDRLRPTYRHYSGVIVDVFYDHFLAANWSTYSSEPLEDYAERIYAIISGRSTILPERVSQMLPYMIRGNWLVNYARVDGIHRALTGMARRTTFDSRMDESVVELRKYYKDFDAEFANFFPQLAKFSSDWLSTPPPAPSDHTLPPP